MRKNYWEKRQCKNLSICNAEIIVTFEDKEYEFIDVKNKVVADIGAIQGSIAISICFYRMKVT